MNCSISSTGPTSCPSALGDEQTVTGDVAIIVDINKKKKKKKKKKNCCTAPQS